MTLSWLLHKYQRSILETLYKNPSESFNLSELARLSGVDPGNTKRYLEKFIDRNVILAEQHGRKTKVRANLANPEVRKVFEMFELSRTEDFMVALGGYRLRVEDFTARVIQAIPDVRMIAMYDVERGLVDWDLKINMAVVVGSNHDVTRVHERVQTIVNDLNFIHEFNICVYTCDNLPSAWNSADCGCVGFWNDRAVLYGEGYYWEMVSQLGSGEESIPEEMKQHA